jgi:RHS repeat-associated protein
VYDLDRFWRTRRASPNDPTQWQPACAATLARETHVSAPLPPQRLKIQLSFGYSDGFGREIQKKIQAESGPVVEGGPDVNPRWVGNGWTIFNNKGKPVRQYEPFFSATHRFEFGVQVGVSPVLFYDPPERVIAALHPNNTFEKVVFDPWQQTTYDVNDTCAPRNAQTGDPRTDPDIRGYVARYFAGFPASPPAPSWQTWRTQRIGGALGPHEQAAATRAAAHADTPTTIHFDALGRPFLTVARNRVACAGHDLDGTEETFLTRVELDIEGNQRVVRDERKLPVNYLPTGALEQRIVMRYAYDMLGNRIHQLSMEAGARWILNDVAGKPIRAWDSRGHNFTTSYDALRRPVEQTVRGTTPDSDPRTLNRDILVDRIEYGEGLVNAEAFNLRTRIYRHFDSAGVATNARFDANGNPIEAYDFKGNLLRSARHLISDYKAIPDWQLPAEPQLEAELFEGSTRYDALNRPIQSIAPHSSLTRAQHPNEINVIQPVFNEANLLERVDVWLERAAEPAGLLDPAAEPPSPVGVANIDYDAKGQRQRIDYKNGARTLYSYDPHTFRLAQLLTRRNAATFPGDDPQPPIGGWPGRQVQNLHYTCDPAGNITHIQDDAQQAIYFRNKRVEPSNDYTYDALYRLLQASGREHLGQTNDAPNPPTSPEAFNAFHTRLDHPGNGKAMGTYIERYVYDAVGNFLQVQHRGTDPAHPGWTRAYDYLEPSLIEDGSGGAPLKTSNRLSRTTLNPNGANPPQVEPYRHDAHGSIVRMPHLGGNLPGPNMHWDYNDQLRQTDLGGGGAAWYVYDASGQRVRKVWEKSPGLTEERIYLGGLEIFRKHGGPIGANTATLERETLHVMDDKQHIALVEARTLDRAGGDQAPQQLTRYQFGNHLGSASLELDEQAQIISYEEYAPYGSSTYQAVRNQTETAKRYRYTGKERDEESGLYYHGVRYFATWLGRWTASDPLGLVDGPNLYRYVRNRPVVLNDPKGTDPPLVNTGDPTDPRNFVDFDSYRAANPSQPTDVVQQVWQQSHPVNPDTPADPEAVGPRDPGPAKALIAHSERLQPAVHSDHTSPGRFRVSGIRTPDSDTTLTPRAHYSNPIAAEAAAHGYVHWAELVEAGHGCSACHVTHNINRIPTDTELDLNQYNTVVYSVYTARAVLEFGLAVGQARATWGAPTPPPQLPSGEPPPRTPLALPPGDPPPAPRVPPPTVDPNTGRPVGRFIVDPRGNTMIEPAGGQTVGSANGVWSESRYPNGSPYQQQHGPHGQAVPQPHGHGFLEGPGLNQRGPSLSPNGTVVPEDSRAAHWPIR